MARRPRTATLPAHDRASRMLRTNAHNDGDIRNFSYVTRSGPSSILLPEPVSTVRRGNHACARTARPQAGGAGLPLRPRTVWTAGTVNPSVGPPLGGGAPSGTACVARRPPVDVTASSGAMICSSNARAIAPVIVDTAFIHALRAATASVRLVYAGVAARRVRRLHLAQLIRDLLSARNVLGERTVRIVAAFSAAVLVRQSLVDEHSLTGLLPCARRARREPHPGTRPSPSTHRAPPVPATTRAPPTPGTRR